MTQTPIACTLTRDAFDARMRLIRQVGAALVNVVRQASGTELRFRRDPDIAESLAAIRDGEAECCAFLRIDLMERPDSLALSIACDDPAGAFMLDELVEAFAAGEPA